MPSTVEFSPAYYSPPNGTSTTQSIANIYNSFFLSNINVGPAITGNNYYFQLYTGTKPNNSTDLLPYWETNGLANALLNITYVSGNNFKRVIYTDETGVNVGKTRFYPGLGTATNSTILNTGTATWFALTGDFSAFNPVITLGHTTTSTDSTWDNSVYNSVFAIGTVGLIGSGADLELPYVNFVQGNTFSRTPAIYVKAPPRVINY